MIVDRRTFRVKPGCEEAVVKMIKEAIEGNTIYNRSYRIYTPDISPYDVVVVEWEYEDVPEMRAAWEAWLAKPGTPEYMEKWLELTERGGGGEIWELAAQR
jgi:hypothetical protein